jgi:hypothetical protein
VLFEIERVKQFVNTALDNCLAIELGYAVVCDPVGNIKHFQSDGEVTSCCFKDKCPYHRVELDRILKIAQDKKVNQNPLKPITRAQRKNYKEGMNKRRATQKRCPKCGAIAKSDGTCNRCVDGKINEEEMNVRRERLKDRAEKVKLRESKYKPRE